MEEVEEELPRAAEEFFGRGWMTNYVMPEDREEPSRAKPQNWACAQPDCHTKYTNLDNLARHTKSKHPDIVKGSPFWPCAKNKALFWVGAPNVKDWIVDEAYVKEITALHYPEHSSPIAGPSGKCL